MRCANQFSTLYIFDITLKSHTLSSDDKANFTLLITDFLCVKCSHLRGGVGEEGRKTESKKGGNCLSISSLQLRLSRRLITVEKQQTQIQILERFSNECRKTKTKVITPANHNRHKALNEPIRTPSKYM